MSGFFSNKYLRYRQAGLTAEIDGDLPCVNCGYNLRGLHYGRNCPECGSLIERASASDDPLLRGDMSSRFRMRWGLVLAVFCVATFPVLYLLGPWVGGRADQAIALSKALLIGGWVAATWLATPGHVVGSQQSLARVRAFVRWSQIAWLPAMLFVFVGGSILSVVGYLCGTVAVAGVSATAYFFRQLAADVTYDNAVWRFNATAWLLPPLALVLVLIPAVITWMMFIWVYLVFFGLTLLLWFFAQGMFILERHLAWSFAHAADLAGRDQRIRERRAELERERLYPDRS